jgi:hypothetical protein
MLKPPRYYRSAWIPLFAGLAWLWCAASFGVVGFLFSVVPGCLLLAASASTLLYPGDARIPQFIALGGLLGVPFAIPALFVAGVFDGLALIVLSALSFLVAGDISVRQEPHTVNVPTPRRSPRLAAQVACDEAILATLTIRLPAALSEEQARIREEVHVARELFRGRGWLEEPAAYHSEPPPLTAVVSRPARLRRLDYEHISFASEYEPRSDEPGRQRWLAREANRTGHAWVLRRPGPPRPWLICIHGYEMGFANIDLLAFQAARLHYRLGVNLLLPVLPLHGPRRIGRRSGEGFLAGDFLDTVHAEAQAMWDIRRLLTWVRAQDAPAVGVYGLSLGGYNAALLAALDADLACVIAGIPATDFTRLTWRHGGTLQITYAEHHGLVHDEVRELLQVVSPLVLQPRAPFLHRYIFAGVADRIVPADQARDLWRHWQQPRIVWYQGAHVTFGRHPEVDTLVTEALCESGLTGETGAAARRQPQPLSA